MHRFGSVFLTIFTLLLSGHTAVAQDGPIPEKRAIATPNTDFFGGDIRSIFDTTLNLCRRACRQDASCAAITFNIGASACFLKNSVEEMTPYDGALSAIYRAADPNVLRLSNGRANDLGFLPDGYVESATTMARSIGFDYPVTLTSAADIDRLATEPVVLGDPAKAVVLRSQLLNLKDNAFGWLDLSRLYLKLPTRNGAEANQNQTKAAAAAINAYLRADDVYVQTAALYRLSTILEKRGLGRRTIALHRLASGIDPGDETAAALERAIRLYGFRVVDHSVDNNAASPRICINFSEDLAEAGADYAQFVRMRGEELPVEAEGSQLCITGVKHGERYAMTLRSGLPAKSGETLLKSADLDIYVRDRAPSVRFTGRAYVLPKSADASIPIVTVNLSEVDLAIHRIGDRNLLPALQANLVGKGLNAYVESTLKEERGTPVWTGQGRVERDLNADVTTALPIGQAVQTFEPGIYVMTARAPHDDTPYERAATQWFIVTDLGLASLSGRDGLHVFVRSLATAEPTSLALVTLIARNNTILDETVTDESGVARFDPGLIRGTGGDTPALITIRDSGGDFAFLDLEEPGLDLSDRGVEGRPAPPPIDVFLTTERGAYRPGETVFATILARDSQGRAIKGIPLTAILTRPDGVEHSRALLADSGAGGRVHAVPLASDAQTGTWRMAVYADPKAAALVTKALLVEDFEPEKIDFVIDLPEAPVDPSAAPSASLQVDYLYGAPGSDLALEGGVRVIPTSGLPDFPGFVFGRHDEGAENGFELLPDNLRTDESGAIDVALPVPTVTGLTKPLQLTATIRVRDNAGRPVERKVVRAVKLDAPRIGIRPLFDGTLEENGLARFEIVAVDPSLARSDMPGVEWTLSRVTTRYQWYQVGRNWKYEPITRRERVASGAIDLAADAPNRIEASVTWGKYELRLTEIEGGQTASSTTFFAGWYSADAGSDTPDILQIGLDKQQYSLGDTAMLRLTPRYAGKALIQVVSDRLISLKAVDVTEGETLVELPVTDDWGPGAYVAATLIRPMDVAARRNPARAIGISWANVDVGARNLSARFVTPDQVDPRGEMDASLEIDGYTPGTEVWATIAAVDVGILNLTGFKTPAPDKHYFGQRKLGVTFRDVYGRLIDGLNGVPGELRSGGDSDQLRAEAPPPDQDLVAQFSGPLQVDANGRITASLKMPDFNGKVRLMAILWSEDGVGHVEKDVLVRDPVVVSMATPRFLAPEDESVVRFDLAHVFGPSGDVTVRVSSEGPLQISGTKTFSVALADKGRAQRDVAIRATGVGIARLRIETTTPDGRVLRSDAQFPVRANDPVLARTTRIPLLAQTGELVLDAEAFAGLVPGSGHATLAIGPLARFNAPRLLSALDRYPYGCTEQITSVAMPLLYLQSVAEAMGLEDRAGADTRIAQAISRVLARQSSSGSFGLWSAGSEDLWLSAYVTDFLSRAQSAGHAVPARGLGLALDYLRNRVNYAGDFETGGEDLAYALMVLAREGQAAIGDLRYYADAKAKAFSTPLALAQLAAALSYTGDQPRADRLFTLAGSRIAAQGDEAPDWRVDFGSFDRDAAAVLTLAAETGTEAIDVDPLTERLSRASTRATPRSTQESAWTLLALQALQDTFDQGSILIDDRPVAGPLVRLYPEQALDQRVVIRNTGSDDVTTLLTVFGIPSEPEPASGDGYQIRREHFSPDGQPIEIAATPLSTRIVTVLTITPERDTEARLMITDPLPAGFEIDNPNLLRAGDVKALAWLKPLSTPEHSAFLRDQFRAAVNWAGTEPFQLAYIMRAVTPGSYHHPAASVEDMYRPQFRARTDSGSVRIER